jgi:hypothetical protein
MMQTYTVLERAFQLARSGDCAGLSDIRNKLKSEGYSNINAQLYGKALIKQLQGLCETARTTGAGASDAPSA